MVQFKQQCNYRHTCTVYKHTAEEAGLSISISRSSKKHTHMDLFSFFNSAFLSNKEKEFNAGESEDGVLMT